MTINLQPLFSRDLQPSSKLLRTLLYLILFLGIKIKRQEILDQDLKKMGSEEGLIVRDQIITVITFKINQEI